MDTGQRIDIVGAGAWGLSAALALLEAGASRVRVWERDQAGSGATGRAAGLVSTHLREASDIRLVLETQRRLGELQEWCREHEEPAGEHLYKRAGNLTLATRENAQKLDALERRIRESGGASRRIRAQAWRESPWPLEGLADLEGLFTEADGYLEAGDLIAALRARVKALGGEVREAARVALALADGACRGIRGPAGDVAADQVVLAAGAWSKSILLDAGLPLPVKPYRTQLAQIEFPSERLPILHDTTAGFYLRPDGPNRILAGDGTEHTESPAEGYRMGTDDSFIEKIAAAVANRCRGGGSARLRTGWAGLCLATPDRNPLIGPDPRLPGLLLMVGDNGFGVMRSLALGALAARIALGRAPPEARMYDPGRFRFDEDFEIREGFEL